MRIFTEKTGEIRAFRHKTESFRRFLNLILTVCLALPLTGQTTEATGPDERAAAAYESLAQGGMVVRLPTAAAKIAAMEGLLAEGNLSSSNEARLRERVAELKMETEKKNKLLMRLFHEYYSVGPVYFAPDTLMPQILEGRTARVLLNDSLALDPDIPFPASDFLILRIGLTRGDDQTRAEGFILSDSRMQPLEPPFPAATVFNNAWYAVNRLLAPDKAEEIRLRKSVERLQQRLSRFGEEE